MDSVKLTPKQKAFADYYIETGNASEAARKAGYRESSARQIGTENLSKPSVSAYIAARMAEIDSKRIASAEEVIEFYSAVMRGEVKDSYGMDASLSDRLKAGENLMKRYALTADRDKGAMGKLDNLLKEFRDAVKSETG